MFSELWLSLHSVTASATLNCVLPIKTQPRCSNFFCFFFFSTVCWGRYSCFLKFSGTRSDIRTVSAAAALQFGTHHSLPGFGHLPWYPVADRSATPSISLKLRPHVGDQLAAFEEAALFGSRVLRCQVLLSQLFVLQMLLWRDSRGWKTNTEHFSFFGFSYFSLFRRYWPSIFFLVLWYFFGCVSNNNKSCSAEQSGGI